MKFLVLLSLIFQIATTSELLKQDFRLLSFTRTEKLILVSHPATKEKLILDASKARIFILDKPGEWKQLETFVKAEVSYRLSSHPYSRNSEIIIDGEAEEIRVKERFQK